MQRKHPNHTYGRNRNNSANNWAIAYFDLKNLMPKFDNFSHFFVNKNAGTKVQNISTIQSAKNKKLQD